MENLISKKTAWQIVSAGASILVAVALKQAFRVGYEAVSHERPPENPYAHRTGWKGAIAWTAVTSVVIGLTSLAAQQGAAAGWERALGHRPPQEN